MKELVKKLIEVGKKVSYLQKDKTSGLKYSFISHDKVTAALRGPLYEAGVYYFVDVESCDHEIIESGDRYNVFATARVAVTFVDSESGETITAHGYGTGVDPSDKATGKAVSYAVKYTLLKCFGLETGDDPENDEHAIAPPVKFATGISIVKESYRSPKPAEGSVKTISPQQQRYIWAWGLGDPPNGLGLKRDVIDKVIKKAGYEKDGQAQPNLIPADQFEALKGMLIMEAEKNG